MPKLDKHVKYDPWTLPIRKSGGHGVVSILPLGAGLYHAVDTATFAITGHSICMALLSGTHTPNLAINGAGTDDREAYSTANNTYLRYAECPLCA